MRKEAGAADAINGSERRPSIARVRPGAESVFAFMAPQKPHHGPTWPKKTSCRCYGGLAPTSLHMVATAANSSQQQLDPGAECRRPGRTFQPSECMGRVPKRFSHT